MKEIKETNLLVAIAMWFIGNLAMWGPPILIVYFLIVSLREILFR